MFETTRIEQLVKSTDYRFYIQDHHNVLVWCLGQGEDSDTSYGGESLESALECYNASLKAEWQPTQALSLLASDVQLVRMDLPINTAYQSEIDFLLNLESIIGTEMMKEDNEPAAAFKKTHRIEAAAVALQRGKVVRVRKGDLGSKVGTELQRLKVEIERLLVNNESSNVEDKWRLSIAPSQGDYLLRARRV
jgi:hypothetical protein